MEFLRIHVKLFYLAAKQFVKWLVLALVMIESQ
jgi:hypothetical protein